MEFCHSLGSLKTANIAGKIRCPKDFALLSLNILELINTWGQSEDVKIVTKPYLFVDTDKLKRAFIVKSNQIVSFAFPFTLYQKSDAAGNQQLYINYRDVIIDASIISKAITLANTIDEKTTTYAAQVQGINFSDSAKLASVRVLEHILMLEPSYLRYDYDKPASNGQFHPLYHFDVNYNKRYSYKFGLYREIDLGGFKNILSKQTICWYTSPHTLWIWLKEKINKLIN